MSGRRKSGLAPRVRGPWWAGDCAHCKQPATIAHDSAATEVGLLHYDCQWPYVMSNRLVAPGPYSGTGYVGQKATL